MLIRISSFLLETVFFLLVGAALLRAWMNWVRVNMSAQPGSFVVVLTNWLVKPLRKFLPRSLTQSRIDWASVIAALLMALTYALIWFVLFAVLLQGSGATSDLSLTALPSILIFAVKMVIRVTLQTLMILLFGYVILSWVQPGSSVYGLLGRLTEPLLTPLRRVVPAIGGVDLSALLLLVILQIGLIVLV